MAKIKKVPISNEELKPTVLATLDDKKLHILGLLLILILFGSVIYFLPDLSTFIEDYLHPKAPLNTNFNVQEAEEDTTGEQVVVENYPFQDNLTIDKDNFTLSSFKVSDNTLSILITNKESIALNLDNYSYYLSLYNKDNTLLQRIKLDGIQLGAKNNQTLNFLIDDANIDYFTLVEIKPDEYPNYTPLTNDVGEARVVCQKDNREVSYLLKENKLYSIEDVYIVNNTDPNLETLKNEYQSLASTYNALNGVESSVIVGEASVTFATYVDLNKNNNPNMNDIIYPLDTDAKVMYFELRSKGYSCK